MLKNVFCALDKWVQSQNTERDQSGTLAIKACEIKVLGQTALLEANLQLHIPATMDVDVFANYEYTVRKKFADLLKEIGKELDPVGHEAWMPEETEYSELFIGRWVKAYLAEVEYIMIAKAKKAALKNKALILEYLALPPPPSFFALAQKYEIDLEWFLE